MYLPYSTTSNIAYMDADVLEMDSFSNLLVQIHF